VLSSHPGRIIADFKNPLTRPRDRHSKEFIKIEQEIERLIGEVEVPAEVSYTGLEPRKGPIIDLESMEEE
jgi:hypothetical protein